ncbi:general odorant-binding protein 69a-like [Aphidius gifuensis]|uniref:Odorant-binding protein n=1 Tax=Aphidius gifuensis TaxID=684658 RepID=A0A3S9LWE9_APHGI|nr:general odorant-binding protein 69a-like [Aphidius gifuensis]AZQ25006.1 odorant-binding protein [Aphidius gifuensis]
MENFIVKYIFFGILLQAVFITAKLPDFITPDMVAMVADDKAKCMGLHGTTEALIDQVNEGTIVNDRAITCYMHCLFETFGVIDEDGELEVEMLVGMFPESIQDAGRELFNKCASQTGSDDCDKVFNIAKCVQQTRPDMWFMI